MKELIKEYNKSLYLVRKLQLRSNSEKDKELLGSMASDLQYSLDWLKSGRRPGNRRGIERRAAYQRERPVDPMKLQTYYSNPSAGKCTVTESDRERLDDALSVLTEREKEMYLMSKAGCLSYYQISLMLNVAKSTVQDTIERSEKKIAKRINESLFCICG
jgi:DNA-directed RNA polymerase specialized sigma24 family protein